MNYMNDFYQYLSKISDIDITYITLVFSSLIIILLGFLLKYLVRKILKVKASNGRKEYVYYQNFKLIVDVIEIILLFFVWDTYIKSLMTLISVLSAAFLLAIRDTIINWFCGIYIKVTKPFKVEDRIEINGIKGDVTSFSSLSFDILEVNDNITNGQSTGVVITFPNSVVFVNPVKNFTKGFKYIWNEMIINVNIDCDLPNNKKQIYKIVNSIDIVKNIPNKMKNQINDIGTNYRIYYNNYDPIIYTRIIEDHIELTLRYLIHPKKARYVESVIWNKIILEYKNGNIDLYNKNKGV